MIMIITHIHTHCLLIFTICADWRELLVHTWFFSDHDADNLEKLLMAVYNMREEKKSNVLNLLR